MENFMQVEYINPKNMSRSERRHHRKRIKYNAIRNNKYGRTKEDYMNKRLLGKNTSCTALCSCFMCGNPRRHFAGLTIQEQLFHQLADLEIAESYIGLLHGQS